MKTITSLCLLFAALLVPALAQAQVAAKTTGLTGSNYQIQPLDVLQITVFKEPDLEQQVRVSAEGAITLPLIGKVHVAGMTVPDTTTLITDLYNRDYLVNPQINIALLSYTERRAYVHGNVHRPGPVIIPPEEVMTLSQVISAAGGRTRMASDTIKLTRTDKDGKKTTTEYDFDDILEDPQAYDITIQDGDSIVIPERVI